MSDYALARKVVHSVVTSETGDQRPSNRVPVTENEWVTLVEMVEEALGTTRRDALEAAAIEAISFVSAPTDTDDWIVNDTATAIAAAINELREKP